MNSKTPLRFWLNGRPVSIADPDPRMTVANYLRDSGLTGTKIACGQGGCGACTVTLSRFDPLRGEVTHASVNACLRPLCAMDGMAITTVEGVSHWPAGPGANGLNPVQRRIAEHNGSQCGYCTPGFVMTMHSLLLESPQPSAETIESAFDGNLCRCTGYRAILDAMQEFASSPAPSASEQPDRATDEMKSAGALRAVRFERDGVQWIRPISLAEFWRVREELEAARTSWRVVAANTSSGIYAWECGAALDISGIEELQQSEVRDDGIFFGAGVTISGLKYVLEQAVAHFPAAQTRGYRALLTLLPRLACNQLRNVATVAGNLCLARDSFDAGVPFPSDAFTALLALGATISWAESSHKKSEHALDAWPTAPGLLTHIHIPMTREREYVKIIKISRREQNSHAIVNGSLRVRFDGASRVADASLAFAGVGRAIARLPQTEAALVGQPWGQATLETILFRLDSELSSIGAEWEDQEFSLDYRISLASSVCRKLFLYILDEVSPEELGKAELSAAKPFHRPVSTGSGSFNLRLDRAPVGEPMMRRSAFLQATGQARYTADLPLAAGTLHAAMVKSVHAKARFTFESGLQAHCANRFSGFRGFFSAADIPEGGVKFIGIANDDPVFADGHATCVGAPLGIVVCASAAEATQAAAWIEREAVHYQIESPVLSLEDAIAKGTEFQQSPASAPFVNHIESLSRPGSDVVWLRDPTGELVGAPSFSGRQQTGAQAHFYMETYATLAVPEGPDHLTLYVSTQDPAENQAAAAAVLNMPASSITVSVSRIGGGFGGKQTRTAMFSSAAAVAAMKLRQPVSLVLDRATDMQMVGKRHPYAVDYHAVCPEGAALTGYTTDLRSDGGDTYDLSFAVMDLSQLHADSAYCVPTFQSRGTVYRTNKPSNTAMRSFGTTQSILAQEDAISQAAFLNSRNGNEILPENIRRRMLYRNSGADDGDSTHFGQRLSFCCIADLWDQLWTSSDFAARSAEVKRFNSLNRWRKRGISMTPVKYGISYSSSRATLNQAGALVNAYAADGSVLVHHGGVEIGQSIDTKMAQIASAELGIPIGLIRVAATSTDAIPNTIATAASTGTDLNGGAVAVACRQLRVRLEKFCRDLEEYTPHKAILDWRTDWAGKWKDIVTSAKTYRVDLSSQALYRTNHYSSVDLKHLTGHPFAYFVYGVSASEAEIDVLTGETVILRSDIIYDAGRSLNPALDVGQIQGGFVQGIGMLLTEELLYRGNGSLLTDNTWTYKPPCSKTIPVDFRVTLADMSDETVRAARRAEAVAVEGSKASGEPPLVLAASVFFAVKHAILAARLARGETRWFHLPAPATVQRVFEACNATPEERSAPASA
jgi:xanthine dehydrogenase/oxidase